MWGYSSLWDITQGQLKGKCCPTQNRVTACNVGSLVLFALRRVKL